MAWKKVEENKFAIVYENNNNTLTINKPFRKGENTYLVWHNIKNIKRTFKTKQHALRFARKWMREHPKG